MPLYDYRCTACGAVTTVFTRSFSDSVDPVCQSCGRREMSRMLSTFAHLGRKAPGSSSGMDEYSDARSIGQHVEERLHRMGVDMPPEAREAIDAARGGAMPAGLDADA
jgi:putative FmdB family regulatory protein